MIKKYTDKRHRITLSLPEEDSLYLQDLARQLEITMQGVIRKIIHDRLIEERIQDEKDVRLAEEHLSKIDSGEMITCEEMWKRLGIEPIESI